MRSISRDGFAISAAQSLPLAPLCFTPPTVIDDHDLTANDSAWIDLDATVAITAHGLLSAMGAIETALNLLRQHPDKGSVKGKIKRAAWDDDFLTQLIGQMR